MEQVKTKIRERFKVYPHNCNYLVGHRGTIFSLAYMKQIGTVSMYGYICVMVDGHWIGAHRMVWMTWKDPVIEPGLEINHIDGVKTNNALGNLEKVTRSENLRHAREVLDSLTKGESHWRWKGYWVVNDVQYTTANEAAKATGLASQTIRKRCLAGVDGYGFIPAEKPKQMTA
ncbi:MAG TPA: HNH endonuclease signature motif containing protein [Daejeonella sp.]|uniref:HNH endonuclease signature motif containing protein n=1 Tax=Daejeonella sp. TaxID=2805397 RepID=UPI002ED83B5A